MERVQVGRLLVTLHWQAHLNSFASLSLCASKLLLFSKGCNCILTLKQAHMELGNRWSEIAKSIAGRSENAVKNHWNATLRRRDVLDAEPGPLKIYMLQNNITSSQKGSLGILQSNKKVGGKGSRGGNKTSGSGTPRKR
eukprot:1143563-Pelagomonas_calceolata.AAC.6